MTRPDMCVFERNLVKLLLPNKLHGVNCVDDRYVINIFFNPLHPPTSRGGIYPTSTSAKSWST